MAFRASHASIRLGTALDSALSVSNSNSNNKWFTLFLAYTNPRTTAVQDMRSGVRFSQDVHLQVHSSDSESDNYQCSSIPGPAKRENCHGIVLLYVTRTSSSFIQNIEYKIHTYIYTMFDGANRKSLTFM